MLLSRVNEIVKIAREYMAKYNLNEREAIECAIEDIEKELKEIDAYVEHIETLMKP